MTHLPLFQVEFQSAHDSDAAVDMIVLNEGARLSLDTRNAEERARQTIHNLNMGDLAEEVGIHESGTGAQRESDGSSGSRDRRNRDQLDSIILQQLNDRLRQIDLQLGELYETRDRLTGEIETLRGRITRTDSAIERLESGDELERNADGSLQNDEFEGFVRDYERRTGQQVDRGDIDALIAVLAAQAEADRHVLGGTERERDATQDEIDGLREQRRRLEEEIGVEQNMLDGETSVERERDMVSDLIEIRNVVARIDQAEEELDNDSESDLNLDELFAEGYASFADEVDPDGAARTPEEPNDGSANNDPGAPPTIGGPAP